MHGIWKTTDGQNFTQLATFTSDQYFESFTYAKGCFYLGYGAAQIGNWGISVASPSTEKAGQIWRFAMPQSDDDGSNDGRDFSNAPWYWDELGVRQAFLRGITGKGVKVGVVTSGGPAPAVGGNYCMALVDVNADENGKWAVVVRNKEIECEFAELPFYKRS